MLKPQDYKLSQFHSRNKSSLFYTKKGFPIIGNPSLLNLCDSVGIQTLNLLIRSQLLYSVELRSLIS